jgi:PAS domain S-box-containing protein
VAAFVDLTDMLQAQAQLAQRELELRTLADNTPDILARFDREHRHVFVSAAIEAATGFKPAQCLGRRVADLGLAPAQCALWESALARVFASAQPEQFEYDVVVPAQRELRTYLVRLVPEFGTLQEVAHVLAIAQDVSEQRRAQNALREAGRHKDEFLATLAHELRNPLAPLHSGLQILQRQAAGEDAQRTCTMMNRQLSHMVRLIDDLLDVSRISAGKITLRRETVSLQAVAQVAVEATRPGMEAGRHRLEQRNPSEPVWVHADTTRLAQVISNLLNNAAKYTPDGGKIVLTVAREGATAVLKVADSGLGIPRELTAEVFRMFTQVDHTLHRAKGGLGIGLALARSMVELHGGTVEAHSDGLNLGSVFTIRLPALTLDPKPASTPPLTQAAPTAPRETGLRVLVVDDNQDAADSLVMLLNLSGHVARAVYDSDQGLEAALAWRPHVAFLDIGMPGRNGYELATALRQQGFAPQPLLVALTGWNAEPEARRSRQAGFDLHYAKPLAMDAMEQVLARAMAARQGT